VKRILFVDDEPRLLEGLQRMLRPQRKQWDMAFAASGPEALSILESGRFDMIVTDMRMPGMDGAQLLEEVQKRFPGVIRVVLSGYVERDAALRAAPVAHQFLAKPCDPAMLLAVLERSCSSTSGLADDTTRWVVGAIGKLPSLPSTCACLTTALQDADVSLAEVGGIIERDVGMTAKVLQLVNSAFFGLVHEVATVRGAVGVLGLDTLQQLVLTVEIFRTFRLERSIPGFSLDAFEHHSHFAARIAALLPAPKAVSSAAVVAALLHDTGKLILASHLPDQFELALCKSRNENRPLHSVERELTGTSHAEIGAYLLDLWGLPQTIVDAVARHHRPPLSEHPTKELDVLAITHIADALAFETERDESGDAAQSRNLLDAGYVASLGLADQVPGWRARATEVCNGRERR
jgi:putative nucleotidyltransferase with HDIG domain